MRLRTIAIALLAFGISCTAAPVSAGEMCESDVTIEHVGKRPWGGSGVFWFVVELKLRLTGGGRFPAYLTYFGDEQRLPHDGDVCRICWHAVSFETMHGNANSGEGVMIGGPGSEPWRSISKLSCGGVDYSGV